MTNISEKQGVSEKSAVSEKKCGFEAETNNDVSELVDFPQLTKQLADCDTSSSPSPVQLLKEAVSAIDDGLKRLYQNGADANTIVYGRANLIDQLINVI